MDVALGKAADDGWTVLRSSEVLEDDGCEGSFVLLDVAESGRGWFGWELVVTESGFALEPRRNWPKILLKPMAHDRQQLRQHIALQDLSQ